MRIGFAALVVIGTVALLALATTRQPAEAVAVFLGTICGIGTIISVSLLLFLSARSRYHNSRY